MNVLHLFFKTHKIKIYSSWVYTQMSVKEVPKRVLYQIKYSSEMKREDYYIYKKFFTRRMHFYILADTKKSTE